MVKGRGGGARPGSRNPEPGTCFPESRIRNPEPGTQNPKPGTWNPESETRNLGQAELAGRVLRWGRCRANVAHIRQSRPDAGLAFQVKFLKMFQCVPSSLGSGLGTSVSPMPVHATSLVSDVSFCPPFLTPKP